jgi:putative transposase
MRVRDGLRSLRHPRLFGAVRAALAAGSRDSFQVVQFSVQGNHIHLIVEADDKASLSSGLNGLAVRCAKAINGALGRCGRVFADRYYAEEQHNPTMMRHLLVYVLFNIKKHSAGGAPRIDPCSSAPWFGGFRESVGRHPGPCPVRPARTWLASEGWLKAGGPISLQEGPAP